jgi:tetratricopeptide (TPR) repeat protein
MEAPAEAVAEEEAEEVATPEEAPVEAAAEEEVEEVVAPEAPLEEFVDEEALLPEADEFIDEEMVARPAAEPETVAEEVVEPVEAGDLEARRADLTSRLAQKPRDYEARLDLARLHCEQHDADDALDQYEKLISARQFLPEVITDLKALSQEPVDRPRLYQLLGDAHMQNDELDEALEMYRAARQALTQR